MSAFNEAQLEQVFVALFKKVGYDYVHGENITRDTRDVILYDDLRHFLQKRYKAEGITEDEINRAIAKLETSEGGGVYAENVEALRLLQEGFSLKRSNPKLPNLYVCPIDYAKIGITPSSLSISLPLTANIIAFLTVLYSSMVCPWWCLSLRMLSRKTPR